MKTPNTTNPTDSADSPILIPGQFPPLPDNLADLLTVTQAKTALRISVNLRDISGFTGVPGTGKTTAATLAVGEHPSIDWRYTQAPLKATTKAATMAVYESVFGFKDPDGEREAFAALTRRLVEGDIGLVIDEVQGVGVVGMQQLRYLWDNCSRYRRPFPMLFVGNEIKGNLTQAREVKRRVHRWVGFNHIQHDDDLMIIATKLHPRLANTSLRQLRRINENFANREISEWANIATHINMIPSTRSQPTAALTKDDIRVLTNLIGTFV